MELWMFEQTCQETRRLTSLSECLQDHLEDGRADAQIGRAGMLGPACDLLPDLLSGIHAAGSRVLALLGHEIDAVTAKGHPLAFDEDFELAASDMLKAVAEISRACEQLRPSSIAQGFVLPDFALLVRLSTRRMLQLHPVRL